MQIWNNLEVNKCIKMVAMPSTMYIWLIFAIIAFKNLVFADTASCIPPCLFVTDFTNIIQVPLDEVTGKRLEYAKPQTIHENDGHIRSLDIDPLKKRIYYGDFWYHTLNSSDLDGGNQRTLLQYAVGHAQGIAVDWTSNNVYWTDSMMKFVEVYDIKRKYRKTLFKLEAYAEPRGIVVNHATGQLFWTDWGKTPKIERSSLSGMNRVTIVSKNLKFPNDLAIDYESRRLFWVDAYFDYLYSCDYDGQNVTQHYELMFNKGLVHPYSMDFSSTHNHVYFSDWQTDRVFVYTDMVGENVSVVYKNKGFKRNIGQIRLLEKKEIQVSNVCANHTCSHMCFNDGANKHQCGCPTGMELSNDRMNCQDVSREYEMYFADSLADTVLHLVKYKKQDGFSIKQLPQPRDENLHSPVALDFDPEDRFVYFSDVGLKKLYRMHEDGGRSEALLTGEVTYGLAVDHINKLLYWFQDDKHLVVSSMNGQNKKTLMRNLESPRDIALYEEKGYIFFNDFKAGLIYRINADGTGLIYLRTNSRMLVTGIAIDKIEDRIYWCDRDKYSVEYTDLNFQNRRKIIQKTAYIDERFWLETNKGFVVRPFDIAVLGERIFWSDTYKRAIYSANKNSGGEIEYVTGGIDHPRDVHVFKDEVTSEYKTIHLITHLSTSNRNRAQCFKTCPSTYSFPDPKPCPSGYMETRFNLTCTNCSDPLGGNFKCECRDWLTCAQRGSGRFFGCAPNIPLMVFKVRECKQIVNPGYCSYNIKQVCRDIYNVSDTCTSDNDCHGGQKCCQDICGIKLCTHAVAKPDHPCTKNNGGCSHFCVVDSKTHGSKCLCPDNMELDGDRKSCKIKRGACPKVDIISTCQVKNDSCTNDENCNEGQMCCSVGCGKTCVTSVKPICLAPKNIGLCSRRYYRWYFNTKTNRCQRFIYRGCGGNENNFVSESDCRKSCVPKDIGAKCYEPRKIGICKAAIPMYYYDKTKKRCLLFYYGGCQGNNNRFRTITECQKACVIRHTTVRPPITKQLTTTTKEQKIETTTTTTISTKNTSPASLSTTTKKHTFSTIQTTKKSTTESEIRTVSTTLLPKTTERITTPKITTTSSKPKTTSSTTISSTSAPNPKCKNYFVGNDCEINVERGVSSIILRTTKNVTKEDFIKSISKHFTQYCQTNECKSSSPTTRRRRLSFPTNLISEKDIYIFEYLQRNDEIRVTFAVLFTDQNGRRVVMSKDSVKNAATSDFLVEGQSGKAQFVSAKNPEKGKSKNNKRVRIVVGIIIALIVLVALGFAGWYIKKKKYLDKSSSPQHLGPVTFENHLYNDLQNDKVQLPEENNVREESHYATPNTNALAEYATAMPPITTLNDYAEVAAAPPFVLPTYEQAASPSGNEKSKDWVKFDSEQEKEKKWIQFTADEEFHQVPISDFGEQSYVDPYDLDTVNPSNNYPPAYLQNNTSGVAIPPELNHSVSIGDLKITDDNKSLPVVGEESPKKEAFYENITDGTVTQEIDVKASSTDC